MKKQILTFLLAILLLLTACQASDPDNLFGTTTPPSSTPDSVPETTVPMEVGILGEAGNAYAYSATQGSRSFAYDGEQIMISMRRPNNTSDTSNGRVLLYTFDIQTGEISLFCQDATCLHNDVECPSYNVARPLEYYQGMLYGKGSIDQHLKVLKDGSFENVLSNAKIRDFFHANGNLYVVTQDNSLVCYPEGDGKAHVILDEYIRRGQIVYGTGLYYADSYGNLYRVDLAQENAEPESLCSNAQYMIDGKHIYYAPQDTNYLYRCNMDGNDSQLLLEEPTLLSRAAFDEAYFYYILHTDFADDPHPSGEKAIDIWRFPKSDPSQKELLVTLPCTDGYVEIIPGYERIFLNCTTRKTEREHGIPTLYSIKPDGTDLREHPLPEA